MRFYLRLAVALAVFLALIFGIQMLSEGSGPSSSAASSPSPAPAATQPTQSAPVPPPGWPPAAVMPTAAPAVAHPNVPRPSSPAEPGQCRSVRQAAEQVGASVISCHYEGGSIVATIQARERNHLGDFLDAAIRLGMKDFDVDNTNYTTFLRSGRPVHQATYRMRW